MKELFFRCVRCGTCKLINGIYLPACPAGETFGFENFYASGKIWLGRAFLEGKINLGDETIKKTIFSCTTCGNCTIQCPLSHGKHILEMYEFLRSEIVQNSGPFKEHEEALKNIKNYGNPYGLPRKKRGEWLKNISTGNSGETLYFAGCTSPLTSFLKDIPLLSAEIVKNVYGNVRALGEEEFCCGSIVLRTGDKKFFAEIAGKNAETFKKMGIKRIVTTCAGCYKTFKFDYPRFVSFPFQVVHTVEILKRVVKKIKVKKAFVTYHDPCHLGRQGGIIDEPREVLKSLKEVRFLEMPRHGMNSFCCGAGGGVRILLPGFAFETAKRRMEEAEKTGAEFLLTSCPFCTQNLSTVADNFSIKVMEIVEFLFKPF